MKTTVLLLAILVLQSCAFHQGQVSGGNYPTNPEYQFDRMVYGYAQTSKLVGIGGLGTDALVLEAKKNLIKNSNLDEDEVLVNYTVDFKTGYYLLYEKTSAIVSAEVMVLKEPEVSPAPTEQLFYPGDRVFLKTSPFNSYTPIQEAFILEVEQPMKGQESFRVLIDENSRPEIKKMTADQKYPSVFRPRMTAEEVAGFQFNIGSIIKADQESLLYPPVFDRGTMDIRILAKNNSNVFIVEMMGSDDAGRLLIVTLPMK